MSANIPSTMPMSDLLKSTGYNCPEELQGKTFDEATSGGDTKISTNTAATVDVSAYTEPVEIEPAEGYDATKKVTLTLENIPQPSDIQSVKEQTITAPGLVTVEPDTGYDAMASVAVTVDISGIEANKEVDITTNGTVEVTPSSGNTSMAKATLSVAVPIKAYKWNTGLGEPLLLPFNFTDAPTTNPGTIPCYGIGDTNKGPGTIRFVSYTKSSNMINGDAYLDIKEGGYAHQPTFWGQYVADYDLDFSAGN